MNHQVTQKQKLALELFSEAEGIKGPRGAVGTTSSLGQSGQVELNQSHAGMSPVFTYKWTGASGTELQVPQQGYGRVCGAGRGQALPSVLVSLPAQLLYPFP